MASASDKARAKIEEKLHESERLVIVENNAKFAKMEKQLRDEEEETETDEEDLISPGGKQDREDFKQAGKVSKKRRKVDLSDMPPSSYHKIKSPIHETPHFGLMDDSATGQAIHEPKTESTAPPANTAPFRLWEHQRKALGWWLKCSKECDGFMLADAKGMGKTIVAVARMQVALVDAKENAKRARFLVISPTSRIPHWLAELGRCPSIKVMQYDLERARTYTVQQIEAYDVVLTSYKVVRDHFYEMLMVRRDFTLLRHGFRYLAEEIQIEQWEKKTGPKTEDEWRLRTKRVSAPLISIHFDEQILDEAHAITHRDTLTSHAVCLIKARSRICITATPLANGDEAIYPLLRFMQLGEFCKKEMIDSLFTKDATGQPFKPRGGDKELILAMAFSASSLRRLHPSDHNHHIIAEERVDENRERMKMFTKDDIRRTVCECVNGQPKCKVSL